MLAKLKSGCCGTSPCAGCGQAGSRLGAEHRAAHVRRPGPRARRRSSSRCRIDVLHVARRNAVVNDGRHQARHDHFHDDLAQHAQRRQDRNELEPVDLFVEVSLSYDLSSLLFSNTRKTSRQVFCSGPATRDLVSVCALLCILPKTVCSISSSASSTSCRRCVSKRFDATHHLVVAGHPFARWARGFEPGVLLDRRTGDKTGALHRF